MTATATNGLTPTLQPPFVAPSDSTSLASGNYTSTAIFERVYFALVSMIAVLQETAAVQSQLLQLQSQWQAAYTDLSAQVPTFLQGDSSPFGGTGTDAGQLRSDLNQFNSMLTENLRNKRTLINDNANSEQTNINQTTNSVDNAANMAQALLQLMQTILSSVTR
jgi:hypothetical protein